MSCAYSEIREEYRLRGGRPAAGQEVERKTRVDLGALARRVAITVTRVRPVIPAYSVTQIRRWARASRTSGN